MEADRFADIDDDDDDDEIEVEDDDDVTRFFRLIHRLAVVVDEDALTSMTPLKLYKAFATRDNKATIDRESLNIAAADGRVIQAVDAIHDYVDTHSGTDLHATIVQTLFLTSDADVSVNLMQQVTFWCLVLACVALDEAPTTTGVDATDKTTILRPRRWQSICFETIRLFQTHLQQSGVLLISDQQCSTTYPSFGDWLNLWTQVMIPCTFRLRNKLSNAVMDAAYKTGVAATCTMLAQGALACGCLTGDDDDHVEQVFLDSLLDLLEQVLDEDDVTMLWALKTQHLLDDDDDDDKQGDASITYWARRDDAEEIAGMHTGMHELGRALLAARAFHRRLKPSGGSMALDPVETFSLWIPHVSTLLKVELDEVIGVDVDHSSFHNDTLARAQLVVNQYQQHGLVLLKQLIYVTPAEFLPCSHSDSSSRAAMDASSNALGTLQLLANRIVCLATTNAKRTNDNGLDLAIRSSQESSTLMKEIVGLHQPLAQVELVRQLFELCPFRDFKPKIVDLLRIAVYWKHVDAEAFHNLWRLIDTTTIMELETHINTNQLSRPDELIQSAELYDSGINLLLLLVTVKHVEPEIPYLKTRLEKIASALDASVESWNNGHQAPDQWFRLHLLDQSLRKLLEVL